MKNTLYHFLIVGYQRIREQGINYLITRDIAKHPISKIFEYVPTLQIHIHKQIFHQLCWCLPEGGWIYSLKTTMNQDNPSLLGIQ